MPTIYEQVKEIVVDKLGVSGDEVEEGSSFVDDLNADSLDLVELIMAFEEGFSSGENSLEIPDEDAGSIATVGDAVNYLRGRGIEDNGPWAGASADDAAGDDDDDVAGDDDGDGEE